MYIPRSDQFNVELKKVERRGNWTKCALLIFKTPLNLRKAVVRIICLELFFFAFKITSSQETEKPYSADWPTQNFWIRIQINSILTYFQLFWVITPTHPPFS